MFEGNINHHGIIQEALEGKRPLDERVLACLGVLEDKLEELKKLGPQFAAVGLSPAVKRLSKQAAVLA